MTDGHHPTDEGRTAQADRVEEVVLDGRALSLDRFEDWIEARLRVRIADNVWKRIEDSAEACRRLAAGARPAYGINTGFGSLCGKRIAAEDAASLQRNLILSHAVGVGEEVPPRIVRLMMLLKVHALTHGVSGASRATITTLRDLLDADILPVVPTQGSLGASGDLAPLAHMVLPLLGEGRVRTPAGVVAAAKALADAGLEPIEVGPKEGLALINGTQFMAAYAVHILVRSLRLAKHADIVASMSLEGLKGSIQPFDERVQQLRPHAGAVQVADNVRRLMTDSEILESHRDCGRVQDPYSLRCVPQVHGASRDAIRHARATVETEINSVTDNPIILDDDTVISGGLFHGQPLALVLDYAAIALSELASISERRIYLLLSGAVELPMLLMKDTGLNSGFMLPQYTAAALVSENKGLCMPSSVDSIPTSLGQEDHVSMGARAAVKCLQVLDNTETVLAIEQMCAAQAIDYREPLKPGVGPRIAHEEIRRDIDHAETDRLFGDDMQRSLALLRSQRVLRAVEAKVGPLG